MIVKILTNLLFLTKNVGHCCWNIFLSSGLTDGFFCNLAILNSSKN